MIRIARLTIPTIKAFVFYRRDIFCKCFEFSVVSIGLRRRDKLRRRNLSIARSIVTAIPEVKPVVIVYGMNLIRPKMAESIRIKKDTCKDGRKSASPSNPSFATIPATIVANAAMGPAIWTLLPPSAEMTNPATIAVNSGFGPTPDASASAMDSGNSVVRQ